MSTYTTGKWQCKVPIYDVHLTLVFGSDSASIDEQRALMVDEFGEDFDTGARAGFCVHNHTQFGIFIALDAYTHGLLAHEVFHCACRIMELIGHDLSDKAHEPHAYLVEWITDWVYSHPWRINGK